MAKLDATTIRIASTTHVRAIPIAATATVYSQSFLLGSSENYSLKYKAASSGTVNLKIELEVSDVLPTTEGSADATNYVVPENFADVESALADENLHIKNIAPPVAKYGRLKITGGAGNDNSTTLTSTLIKQTEL